MASPPGSGATSPPGPPPLALPRQRPTLVLPGQHSRKPSATSASLSAHPLRQTSFPPQESLDAQHARARDTSAFSPDEDLDDLSDEINSAVSGPVGEIGSTKKRKRGEKGRRGRGGRNVFTRTGSASVANGDETRTTKRNGTAGAPSIVNAGEEADVEDEEEEEDAVGGGGRVPLYEGGQMTAAEVNDERERKRLFYESVTEQHRSRAESYYRAKLLKADVRKLVNQTLSQSVPANVVLVVASYTKLFAGMLVEEARQVQAEWAATEPKRPDGEENRAFKKIKHTQEHGFQKQNVVTSTKTIEAGDEHKVDQENLVATGQDIGIKQENGADGSHEGGDGSKAIKMEEQDGDMALGSSPAILTPSDTETEKAVPLIKRSDDVVLPGGAGGLWKDVDECDLGPLLPDHLREALRRYKKARGGGTVGFTGLSLEGREVAAARMGGRRLFR